MASTKKQGYVITRAKSLTEYFTASAAYDRPQWVKLSEATVYLNSEAAQQAVKKLWMNGAFASKVEVLSELVDIEMEMPNDTPRNKPLGDDDAEMVASHQSDTLDDEAKGICPECDSDPCECDEDRMDEPTDRIPTDGDEVSSSYQSFDELGSGEQDSGELGPDEITLGDEHEEDSLLGQHLKGAAGMEAEETARLHPEEIRMLGRKRMDMKETHIGVGSIVVPNIGPHKGVKHEVIHMFDDGVMNIAPIAGGKIKYRLGAAKARPEQVELVEYKLPTRPGNDPATPSENKDTVPNLKAPYDSKQVDFEDPVGTEDKPDTDLNHAVSYEHDEKITVPSDIKAQLKAVISNFEKAGEDNDKNMNDETKASFEKTAASALQQLLDDLELGTTAGIKQAQIHMTSYMNPITTHIPADVMNFIGRGGRKSSLKDLFAVKWEKARGVE